MTKNSVLSNKQVEVQKLNKLPQALDVRKAHIQLEYPIGYLNLDGTDQLADKILSTCESLLKGRKVLNE